MMVQTTLRKKGAQIFLGNGGLEASHGFTLFTTVNDPLCGIRCTRKDAAVAPVQLGVTVSWKSQMCRTLSVQRTNGRHCGLAATSPSNKKFREIFERLQVGAHAIRVDSRRACEKWRGNLERTTEGSPTLNWTPVPTAFSIFRRPFQLLFRAEL